MHRFCPACQAQTPWIPGSRWFCDGCGMNDDDHGAPAERYVKCGCGRMCLTLPGVLERCERCNGLVNDGVCALPEAPKPGAHLCIPKGVQLYQIDEDGNWQRASYVRLPNEFTVKTVKYGFVWLDAEGLAALLWDWRQEWEEGGDQADRISDFDAAPQSGAAS